MSLAKIGIFFVVNQQILADTIPVRQGEQYGNAICHGGHYDFWETLIAQTPTEAAFKARAYDAYPRGRVVYQTQQKKFVLYADTCLDKNTLRRISDLFHVANPQIARDEHYQCAVCNPDYMD